MTENVNNEKTNNESIDGKQPKDNNQSIVESEEQIPKPNFPINREVIREDMVKTAVNFLMNPRVRESPLTQKRTFLLRKGLSLDEIDSAIDRLNALNVNQRQSLPLIANNNNNSTQPLMSAPVQPMPSFMARSSQFVSSMALFGGFLYGAYVLYKRFVEPFIFEKQRKPHPFVIIQQQLDQLSKAMSLLQTNVSTIESNIKQQIEDELHSIKAPEEVTLHELKTELASIKALLVNRRQFPATPVGGIPLWQINDKKDTNNSIDNPINDDSNQSINGLAEDLKSSDNTNEYKLTNGSVESIATETGVNGLQD